MTERMFSLNARKLLAKASEKWPAKVISVVLAIVLFVFHQMSDMKERFFSVPLHVELKSNMIPASAYPRMIRVTLRGDANSIYPIVEGDIEAYIDLSKYSEPGQVRAPVQIRKLGTAGEVETLEIGVDPIEISLELDLKISKTVPLTPDVQGYLALANGYELVSYSLEPTQVTIEGPRRIIDDISELVTEPIDLGGRHGDFFTDLRILNPNSLVSIRGDGIAEYRALIRAQIIIKSFDGLPISVAGLDPQFTAELEVNTGSIRIDGSQNELDAYVPPEPFLILDCTGISEPGTYTLPVSMAVPSEFTLSSQEPEEVRVLVTRQSGEEE
jgi:YbbR domain-containing protein